jgi:hypothetical protein
LNDNSLLVTEILYASIENEEKGQGGGEVRYL